MFIKFTKNILFCKLQNSQSILLISIILFVFILNIRNFMQTKSSVSSLIPTEDLPWWDDPELKSCKDPSTKDTVSMIDFKKYSTVIGNCGYRSFLKGYRQNVISFSLYGTNQKYWNILNETLTDALKFYHGWNVRLYLNPRSRKEYLCSILLHHQHMSICDVENLPLPLGNISSTIPMLWRSAPMGDPLVSRFAVRDTDSVFSSREEAAVTEWVQSGKLLHVMRDHPQHGTEIMGGLFGIYQPTAVLQSFAQDFSKLRNMTWGNDQQRLKHVLYEKLANDSLQHDSYLCRQYPLSVPYPTQREGGFFLGAPVSRFAVGPSMGAPCPPECRPKEHQDWEYC